ARAIVGDGCELVGWIANQVDPHMERQDENFRMLGERIAAPCWGRLPWLPDQDAARRSRALTLEFAGLP
ncbi:MAG: dethiobiotin synthase, partial [Pseudoxanthomonas sp.]